MTNSLYLSRLILNPRSRRVRKELANPYELHRSLMRSFPEKLTASERVLFRVETDEDTGIATLLLQSHTRPDWAWLTDDGARDYLLPNHLLPPTIQPPNHLSITDFNFSKVFTPGQTLAFRLRANPTEKRWLPKDKDDPNSEKKPVRMGLYATEEQSAEERQRAWLERKGAAGGFRILSITIAAEGKVYGKTSGETRHALQFDAVRFEGLLQVTDPAKLWATLQQGIGPGKGLGFGLLSLAPPH